RNAGTCRLSLFRRTGLVYWKKYESAVSALAVSSAWDDVDNHECFYRQQQCLAVDPLVGYEKADKDDDVVDLSDVWVGYERYFIVNSHLFVVLVGAGKIYVDGILEP
ncbi:unnamed protein product, partial [Hapterophycus canaliculatus]